MFDSMAFNADELTNMHNAVQDYTDKVQGLLDDIQKDEITGSNGVYGEAQIKTINKYISDTVDQIHSIVKYFDTFKDALSQVSTAYDKKQQSISMGPVQAHEEADPSEMITVHME